MDNVKLNYNISVPGANGTKATISVNAPLETYLYFISKESCPTHTKKFVWDKMSKKERLKTHLNLIAEDRGGKIADYYIFND